MRLAATSHCLLPRAPRRTGFVAHAAFLPLTAPAIRCRICRLPSRRLAFLSARHSARFCWLLLLVAVASWLPPVTLCGFAAHAPCLPRLRSHRGPSYNMPATPPALHRVLAHCAHACDARVALHCFGGSIDYRTLPFAPTCAARRYRMRAYLPPLLDSGNTYNNRSLHTFCTTLVLRAVPAAGKQRTLPPRRAATYFLRAHPRRLNDCVNAFRYAGVAPAITVLRRVGQQA